MFNLEDNNGSIVDGMGNLSMDSIDTERKTIIRMLIDQSGSMTDYTQEVVDGLELFKSSIEDSKESDEILVGITRFDNSTYVEGYQPIDNFNTSYSAGGCTALYDAIVEAQEGMQNVGKNGYMDQLRQNGNRVNGMLVIFSDGEDVGSNADISQAKQAIEYLLKNEICVCFFAFGGVDLGQLGLELGIPKKNIRIVNQTDASSIRRMFGLISKSVISVSKKAKQNEDIDTVGFLEV